MEAGLVARYQLPYAEISAAGLHGVGLRSLPGNLVKLLRGYIESRRVLREFKPDVLLFTGGYVAVPMALAGVKINSLLYVPDIEPGLALKALSRFANVIALTSPASRQYFRPGKRAVVTGYPTRSDLQTLPRDAALAAFNLSQDLPVLLVIGGSKGAHSLNQAIFDNLNVLLERVQVLHVTGQLDWQTAVELKAGLPTAIADQYQAYAYLHDEISIAFSAATIVLSRAGASTLGELPLYGLPAILVPYPYAWRYQKVNAEHLVKHAAAVILENAELNTKLVATLNGLLADAPKLAAMRANMRALAAPAAATAIADLLVELGSRKEGLK
jgi:UDP-N-acetylglucosamine--N-acetylmuramyl-(pentapeptide) pyrophosphoryl-undecaprenol N-acetylglucosamine transferase